MLERLDDYDWEMAFQFEDAAGEDARSRLDLTPLDLLAATHMDED